MNDSALAFIRVISIGIGATLTIDLWALFLKRVFKIAAPNYCLVGRCDLKDMLDKQRPQICGESCTKPNEDRAHEGESQIIHESPVHYLTYLAKQDQ